MTHTVFRQMARSFVVAVVCGTAIAALSPTQRELLLRRYVNDLSLADIGARTGTTVSAVRQRLDTAHRAVARQLVAA